MIEREIDRQMGRQTNTRTKCETEDMEIKLREEL